MSKLLYLSFFIPLFFIAQPKTKQLKEFDQLKLQGKLKGNESIKNPFQNPTNLKVTSPVSTYTSNVCSCWKDRDSTWLVCPFNGSGASGGPGVAPLYRNDDWSTASISLPFNFCLYGTNYNSCFINNNGNVSFGSAYSTFTANSFPDPTYIMVAPFWGDVDTRNAQSGVVYYKLTPTYLIVQWDQVGYYSQSANLKNSFQLIMSDGSDPIISNGNNVAFCYKDMQWTTGSASGGSGGFGGTPATVGVNKGDGINYIQFGLFDQAGSNYDGPGGNNDGVSWLDNQSIYFNSCTNNNNIAPISTGALSCGDTITICGYNDTLYYSTSFSAPEIGQTCTVTATSPTLGSNLIVTNTTSGNTSTLDFIVIANPALAGFHQVNVTATDNGSPGMSSTITYVINVVANPAPVVTLNSTTGQNVLCSGANTTLVATTTGGTPPYTISWQPNISSNDSAVVSATGTYSVIIADSLGCGDTMSVTIQASNPNVSIIGDSLECQGGCFTLVALPSNGTLPMNCNWGSITNDTLVACSTGTYQVIVTDSLGCVDSASISVSTYSTAPPTLSANTGTGNGVICNGSPITIFTALSGGAPPFNYAWFPNVSNSDTASVQNPGTFQVIISDSVGCKDTATITVTSSNPNVSITGDLLICPGECTTLYANANGGTAPMVNTWAGVTTDSLVVCNGGTFSVLTTDNSGCVDSASVLITQDVAPVASFTTNPVSPSQPNVTIGFTSTSTIASGNITNYYWSFGDNTNATGQNTSHSYAESGSYSVTLVVVGSSGCVDTISGIYVVDALLNAPNIITPNNDGINDALYFKGLEYFSNNRIYIYNRWGQLIYDASPYNNNWKGENQPDGTYFYILEVPDGKPQENYSGYFMISR
jgi:gliding motility-associated-like protein